MSGPLTHFDAKGEAHMVDVSAKPVTDRLAVARGAVRMAPETLALITEGGAKKGDVLGVARLAGIMAAKKTADLADVAAYGARCFLIGEALMRQADVTAATRTILSRPLTAEGGL